MNLNSATFDGKYWGDPDIATVVRAGKVPALAGVPLVDVRDVAYGLPVIGGEGFGAGKLVVPVSIMEESGRGPLMKLLSRPGKRFLMFDNFETDIMFRAKVTKVSSYVAGSLPLEINITFATDPFRLGRTEESYEFAIDESPESISIPGTGRVLPGNAIAHPRWILKNTKGSANTGTVTLANTTTNESASWIGSIANNEYLIFDATQRETVEAGADANNPSDAMSGYVAGGVLPTLEGGVVNSITVTGMTGGTLYVSFYPEYY